MSSRYVTLQLVQVTANELTVLSLQVFVTAGETGALTENDAEVGAVNSGDCEEESLIPRRSCARMSDRVFLEMGLVRTPVKVLAGKHFLIRTEHFLHI